MAPLLLRVFLATLLARAPQEDITTVAKLALDRALALFGSSGYSTAVRRVLARDLLLPAFAQHPPLVVGMRKEMTAFLGNTDLITDATGDFFSHVAWLAGEFAVRADDADCAMPFVGELLERLEVAAYVANFALLASADAAEGDVGAVRRARVVVVLLSALAKATARYRERSAQTLVCLRNVLAKHPRDALASPWRIRHLVARGGELINTLTQPGIALGVLGHCPSEADDDTPHPGSITLIM